MVHLRRLESSLCYSVFGQKTSVFVVQFSTKKTVKEFSVFMGLKMRCINCAVINVIFIMLFQIVGVSYYEFRWNFVFFSSALIEIHPHTCKTLIKIAPKWIISVQFSIMYICFAMFN